MKFMLVVLEAEHVHTISSLTSLALRVTSHQLAFSCHQFTLIVSSHLCHNKRV